MKQLNLKFYLLTILCFVGTAASAQGTQDICIGDIKNYSVDENAGSSYDWQVEEEAAFEGKITPNGAGNAINIDWGDTPVGTYTLTVIETNSEGCPGEPVSATININPLPDAPQVALTQPGCGEEVGSAKVTSPTGTDIQYSIDGGTNFQPEVDFSDLDPGTYEVIAQNALGCTSEPTEFEIKAPLVIPETPEVNVTQPECGDTEGAITIESPSGSSIQFSIDGGATYQDDASFTELDPGDYDVIVSNGDCESQVVNVTINPAPIVPADPVLTIVDPDCGDEDGIITITSPVDPNLEYSADGGDNWQDDPEFVLAGGETYQIQVRHKDSDCTSAIVDATIEEAPEVPETSAIQFE